MKKSSENKKLKVWRQQVARAHERVVECLGTRLGEADLNTLAGVFAIEENALQLCEQGEVGKAISLLKEQKGAMVPVAITILQTHCS